MEIQPTLHVRPDKKGPKNIAILLFISAFLVAGMGFQDWQLHHEGLNDSQIEVFLTTPNSQEGEPTSVEDYRDFEASVQEENGYLIRAVALLFTATCLLVGSVLLHRLQRRGAIICVTGAVTGLIGGVAGSIVINQNAQEYLGEAMKLTYEIWVYLCGSIMGLCLAVAALPLLNARARLALTPSVQLDDSGNDFKLDSNSSYDSNLKQTEESSNKKTEDKDTKITYNIQNISIHDSVVIDSDLSSGKE